MIKVLIKLVISILIGLLFIMALAWVYQKLGICDIIGSYPGIFLFFVILFVFVIVIAKLIWKVR